MARVDPDGGLYGTPSEGAAVGVVAGGIEEADFTPAQGRDFHGDFRPIRCWAGSTLLSAPTEYGHTRAIIENGCLEYQYLYVACLSNGAVSR